MSGQAFEFTPGGVLPLAEPVSTGVINAAAAVAQIRASAQSPAGTPAPHTARPLAKEPRGSVPKSRGALVKEIRERLRFIERELKNKAALESEAADLRRGLAALKQPPATVANIHRARSSG